MKHAALLTLLTCVSLVAFSQTPGGSSSATSRCTLTAAQSPEIRSVRLGMTAEQLLAQFPDDTNRQTINDAIQQSKRPDKYGAVRFDLRSDPKVRDERFAGISYIVIEMLDQRVSGFHIGYAGPQWNSIDEFVAKLADALRLPTALWEPPKVFDQSLKCDGFVVDAHVATDTSQHWVRVQDTSVSGVVLERREAAKEKARQAFKP